MTTATRTNLNDQPRKTLSSQLDRLDGILDGLDAALAGAVQEAVEQAVKQAVQAVLTEVLTNRELQEQLHQAAQPAPPLEPPPSKQSMLNRLGQATTECVRRTAQTVKKFGLRVPTSRKPASGAWPQRRRQRNGLRRIGGSGAIRRRWKAGPATAR